MRTKRLVRRLAAAAILAFLAFSPPWLIRGLQFDEYRAILEGPKTEWHGRIELWHVAGFRVYQGSITDYLKARAKAYCKQHPGVHIDVVGLTEKRYYDRIARGQFPDAYSFPSGLVYPEQLRALPAAPEATFRGTLRAAGTDAGTLAVPYLMSGYFLAVNTQRAAKYGFVLPEEADAEFLQAALDLPAAPELAAPAILAARLGLTGALAEQTAFTKGNAMLSVLDARALGDILRSDKTTLLLDAAPCGAYSDEVLYLGAAAGADDRQAQALFDFIAFLLSEKEQQRLSTLGALPVVRMERPAVYADDLLEALERAYAAPVVPEPFLLQRHRAALEEDARAALTGDAAARKAFFERMAVVESGNL